LFSRVNTSGYFSKQSKNNCLSATSCSHDGVKDLICVTKQRPGCIECNVGHECCKTDTTGQFGHYLIPEYYKPRIAGRRGYNGYRPGHFGRFQVPPYRTLHTVSELLRCSRTGRIVVRRFSCLLTF